jgi:hypothetical protein
MDNVNISRVSSVGMRRRLLSTGIAVLYTVSAPGQDFSTVHDSLVTAANSTLFTTIIQQQTKLSTIVAQVPIVKNVSPTPAPTSKPTIRPTVTLTQTSIATAVVTAAAGFGLVLGCFLYYILSSRRRHPTRLESPSAALEGSMSRPALSRRARRVPRVFFGGRPEPRVQPSPRGQLQEFNYDDLQRQDKRYEFDGWSDLRVARRPSESCASSV